MSRLTKLKADHEGRATSIDDSLAEHFAGLIVSQTVTSLNQSGGITAGIVNAQFNFHQASLAVDTAAPDWSIHDLFYYLRPTISPDGPTSFWDEVGGEVLDKLSAGHLQAWGREINRGATTQFLSLAPIDRSYWRAARFTYVFLLDDRERDLHATQLSPSNLPNYGDLRVNREQSIKLWPHPVLGRWDTSSITLTARYFNHAPDEVSLECKTITLFGAHVETRYDGTGAPSYQDLIAPGYIMASGINPTTVRSLAWQPQELSFTDSDGHTKLSYMLTGNPDALGHTGKARFLLEELESKAWRSVSPEAIQLATEFFNARAANAFQVGIHAPVALLPGPKLVLRALPIAALGKGHHFDRAGPQLLSRCFMPDEYENSEGHPRQEGWVWFQPPRALPSRPNPVSNWYSQLNWNGYAEIAQVLDDAEENGRAEIINGYRLERCIVKAFDAISEGYQKLGLRSAVVLRAELFDVLGSRMAKSTPGHSHGFDRPVVISEAVGLSQMTKPIGRALRPLLDSLWLAAGWANGSPSYGRGDWDGYANPIPYQ